MTNKKDIEMTILLQNNMPVDDFLGLTANEMHHLLYEPFGEKSPVQFQKDIDDKTLYKIPLFRIAEAYLKIIERDKQIKLTPLGALPRKVMVELYDKRFLLDEYIETGITKLWKQQDCISIMSMRYILEYARLVRKVNGKLILTKNGAKLIEAGYRVQLFKAFLEAFTEKFLWGNNDGYSDEPIGQFGWAFSALMLHKYGGQERTVDFYADKYRTAFPMVVTLFRPSYTTPDRQFTRCYAVRTFDRFFLWFAFVSVDKQGKFIDLDKDKFKKTETLNEIFSFDEI